MHLRHLSLTNTRTFRSLELGLAPGAYVVMGPNASGKTNLLQSIAMLATTRSAARSGTDGEQISWDAVRDDPLPAASLSAIVETATERVTAEIVIASREVRTAEQADRDAPPASRRFRVNGVARRASDLIGRLRVVLFSADDLQMIDGPPANRRRYLDMTISQISPPYVRALQRYRRVLEQRNSLLRRLQERRAQPDELRFWDDELARAAAEIIHARADTIAALARDVAQSYSELVESGETLTLEYQASLPGLEPGDAVEVIEQRMHAALDAARERDIYAARTRVGPHRDDLVFLLDGHHAGTFGSRGQQRSVALALRLAEVRLSTARTGDPPVLLLDDVLSELDAERRARVLATRYEVDQVLITTPDGDRPSAAELPGATRLFLRNGTLVSADGTAAP